MWKKFGRPSPQFFILAVLAIEILTWLYYRLDSKTPQGKMLIMVMIIVFLLASIIISKSITYIFPCNLFRGPVRRDKYDSAGNLVSAGVENENCGEKSIGKVRVKYSGSNVRSTEYFCEDHDPETKWMKDWLRRQGKEIDYSTTKRFLEVGDSKDDDEGPDLPI